MEILKTVNYNRLNKKSQIYTDPFYVSIYKVERGDRFDNYIYTGVSFEFSSEEEALNFAREKNKMLDEGKKAMQEEYMGENETL